MLIGTNPDDPTDLGAEVELQMGADRERHTMTKSTVVFIPPNLIHCPYIIKRTDRPWIFVEINQGPVHTEKLFPQILTEEERAKVDWSRWKEEGYP
jgi:oxalate decarboxylase/phosphoglucose isomerase-like protein (cupin superfamily)